MIDTIASFLATHGNTVLFAGLSILGVLSLLAGRALVWVGTSIKNQVASQIVVRALQEIQAIVVEVWQTYVTAITKGRADGKLTPEEAAEAKRLAWEKFVSNWGLKGLQRLARALGLDGVENWVKGKIESAVGGLKLTQQATAATARATTAPPQ